MRWTACSVICVNFIHRAVCVSELQFFFLRESWRCCLAICTVTRLSSFSPLTVVVSVTLEWNSLCPRFQTSPHGWSVWQLLPLLEVDCCYLFVCLFCSTSGKISVGTVGIISIRWKMFYKINLDANNRNPVTQYIVYYGLAVAQGRREDHSTGFV